MDTVFWAAFAILYYIYDGYLRVLSLLARSRSNKPATASQPLEALLVTVLITARNEAHQIAERYTNIAESDYPGELIEIIVASDSSDDGTDEIVRTLQAKDPRLRLFRNSNRLGKTDTQNHAIGTAKGDIVVFADAATRFDKSFLAEIIKPFRDPQVGGVDGHLVFQSPRMNGLTESQDRFWNYELRLRRLESDLGLLAVASGACLAVRKKLIRPMNPTTGEDCILPLDVVRQGYKMVHATNALAYDQMECDPSRTLNVRTRMTIRNWQGTWLRPELLNPLRYPGYAFSLWSHKLLRWLSPVFLIVMSGSAFVLGAKGSMAFLLISTLFLLFYVGGLIGWFVEASGLQLPFVTRIYSFLLANLGFLLGLCGTVMGKHITAYR